MESRALVHFDCRMPSFLRASGRSLLCLCCIVACGLVGVNQPKVVTFPRALILVAASVAKELKQCDLDTEQIDFVNAFERCCLCSDELGDDELKAATGSLELTVKTMPRGTLLSNTIGYQAVINFALAAVSDRSKSKALLAEFEAFMQGYETHVQKKNNLPPEPTDLRASLLYETKMMVGVYTTPFYVGGAFSRSFPQKWLQGGWIHLPRV